MANVLPKSLREKNRYIVFRINCDKKLERAGVVKSIVSSQLRLFGETGSARHNMWIMDFEEEASQGIVKCAHKSVDEVKASIFEKLDTLEKACSADAASN